MWEVFLAVWQEDELGVLTVGLLDFLTDKKILEQG